ncbi:Predicted metal-dependent phosphohydrolase, HD superfamily [Acinetobacter marinus]|uniref:Predicted metal-dependent phosphohydrolase, HD superfamily n=1 Tax=Acinetobacter marinus TaxID=281375 RepID=A0A1G6GPD3_9GAMM|nr:hypothetical protein [Acinetobacter marinus]SDB83625.1 Predicted metal-dependent phosphohydrolase, HD superfamily [Acinetobacter marinus]
MLKITFLSLLDRYTTDEVLKNQLWAEIETHYAEQGRHYHTLLHLEALLTHLNAVESNIACWDSILFCLYYHDMIYDVNRSDNEEKSAELATQRMTQLKISNEIIQLCRSHILATKSHQRSTNQDTNYFLDADLSILGQAWDVYSQYTAQIRQEYAIYPEKIYSAGRKKVVQHFLEMQRIYKTDYFYDRLEAQAKCNLQQELHLLNTL